MDAAGKDKKPQRTKVRQEGAQHMKTRRIALIGLAILAVTAMADGPTGAGVKGRGIVNSDTKKARIDIEVGERTINSVSEVRGRAEFELKIPGSESERSLRVIRVRATGLTVTDKHAVITGNGMMHLRANGQAVNKPGTVAIEVNDNKGRDAQTGDPDTYTITFTGTGDNPVNFTYTGTVSPGDIGVRAAQNVP